MITKPILLTVLTILGGTALGSTALTFSGFLTGTANGEESMPSILEAEKSSVTAANSPRHGNTADEVNIGQVNSANQEMVANPSVVDEELPPRTAKRDSAWSQTVSREDAISTRDWTIEQQVEQDMRRGEAQRDTQGDFGLDRLPPTPNFPNDLVPTEPSSQDTKRSGLSPREGSPELDIAAFLQGIAKPVQDAELRSAVPGVVMAIHVREGDRVRAGDPLITLDNRVAQAAVAVAHEVAQSKAALKQAEWDLKAAQSLVARTQVAYQSQAAGRFELEAKQNQLEQATAAYELQLEISRRAAAELKLAEAELEQKTLRAPFAGNVLEIKARLGNTITVEDIALRVADLNHLRVEMHLPVGLLGTLEQDQVYDLEMRSLDVRRLPAFVEYVSPVVEPTSGTFRVVFNVDNNQHDIPPGVELWLPEMADGHLVSRKRDRSQDYPNDASK